MTLLIYSLAVILLAIVSGFLMLWKIPQASRSDSLPPNPGENVPGDRKSLSIIIPARNEEHRLPPLLDSLAQQDIQDFEWIVVDDQSEDRTGEIAAAAGARVIRTEDRDERWIGKSYACWRGACAATGTRLLFLDADTRMESSDSLRRILATYEAAGAGGILSFQPYHRVVHLYESLSTLFNIIVMAGINVFTPWSKRLKGAGAFGPCILCDRDEYFRTGGHEAIGGAVMDDLALGDLYRKNGLQVLCYSGRGLISFRMYPEGFGQLFEGWTKNFGTASQSTHPFVFALIIAWISGGFSTTALLIRALAYGSTGWIITAGAAYLAYMLQLIVQARRTGNFHLPVLILYPLLHLFFTILFLWSLFLTKVLHTVRWRGRNIKV